MNKKINTTKERGDGESFRSKVYAVVRNIPKGTTLTYKAVAIKAGRPRAARAVGRYMRENHDVHVPCHRVIRSNGTVGEYNRGGEVKKYALLRSEGWIS